MTIFASVFTLEDNSTQPPSPPAHDGENFIYNFILKESDILHTIKILKVNKTPGPDQISPKILKEVKNEICEPLSVLFNKSLTTGKVPNEWKLGNATPVNKKKKSDKSHIGNYCPISLTSVVCKLMETIIRDKIACYFEDNKLITFTTLIPK